MDTEALKESLKKVGWIYSVNAAVKARGVRRAYERTLASYAKKRCVGGAESILIQRSGARLRSFQNAERPLRIFYMGTDEQQDRSGTLQALEKLGPLAYFVQPDGKYGQFLNGPRVDRQRINGQHLLAMFERLQSAKGTPNVLFGQLQAGWVSARALDEV